MRIDYPMPQPAGLARYDGAGGVISLTTAPAFGVALPADPLESKTIGLSGEFRTIRYLDIDVSGVGVFATYDGVTPPTAANGFPIGGPENWKGVYRADLALWQFFIPAGVKMYVRYFWGSK
jgi:hypothetical protein